MAEEKAVYDRLLSRALELSSKALSGEIGGQIFIEGAANIV